jgi:hypothetical protein
MKILSVVLKASRLTVNAFSNFEDATYRRCVILIKLSFHTLRANLCRVRAQCKSSFTSHNHRDSLLHGEEWNNKDARLEGCEQSNR